MEPPAGQGLPGGSIFAADALAFKLHGKGSTKKVA
jgi:hypothetical protein